MAKRSFTRCSPELPFSIKKRYSGSSWSNGETTTSQYCGGEKQSSILRTYTQAGTQKRRKTMLHKRLVPRTWHLLYCDKTRIFALQCETCSRRYSTTKTLQLEILMFSYFFWPIWITLSALYGYGWEHQRSPNTFLLIKSLKFSTRCRKGVIAVHAITGRYFGTNFHLFTIYIAHDILLKFLSREISHMTVYYRI